MYTYREEGMAVNVKDELIIFASACGEAILTMPFKKQIRNTPKFRRS